MRALRLSLLLVSMGLVCYAQDRSTDSLASASADDLTAGEQIFARRCAVCHGPQGEGQRGPTLAKPRLLRAPDDDTLLLVIRRGIEGTEMPGARMPSHELRQVAAWVRKLGQRPVAIVPGDPQRGATIFQTKGACTTCHTVSGHGGAFGPDLTDIGQRRGAAHLRASVVDPEADVPKSFGTYRDDVSITENFLQVRVVTREGKSLLGVRVNEDSFSIQIRDMSGRVYSFFKTDLRELHKDWGKSPMPSYAKVLSPEELDDVIAYLASLRTTG
jgi:cytochrome c oxidase cbb3-type subunit III